MTEACTLVSLLIVVWCLHAFGPRTNAMARGSLTAETHELVLSVEKVLCLRAQRCGAALSMCAFHGWVHKAHIPPPPTSPVCLCLCGYVCVRTYVGREGEGEGGGYNNKLGSSVTLNSPIFQEESKQSSAFALITSARKSAPRGH